MVHPVIQKSAKDRFLDKIRGFGMRNSISLILVIILVLGAIVTFAEIRHKQNLQQQASISSAVLFVDTLGNPITQTSSSTVNVLLTAPWPVQGIVYRHRERNLTGRIHKKNIAGVTTTVIYEDSLQGGWTNGSYKASVNFNNTSPVYSGSNSISVTARGGGGLEFNAPRNFLTTPYTHIQFAIRASQQNQDLGVYAENANFSPLGSPVKLSNYGGFPSITGWTLYTIPLSDLKALNRTIGDITIQNNNPKKAMPVFYADQVQLVNLSNSSTPTPFIPTSPNIPTPTLTPIIFTASVILAEDSAFTKNVKTISPYSSNPLATVFTFSDSTPGTKTLYAKFTASNGTTQIFGSSIQLGQSITSTPVPPTPTTLPLTPLPTSVGGGYGTSINGLRVRGAQIVNSANQQIRMVGVNFSGAEYTCMNNGGNWDVIADQNAINAMKTWHIRVVRITLNEDCWLGINGITSAFATNHRQAVVDFANLLIQNNIVPLINLHFSGDGVHPVKEQEPMANRTHSLNFWTSVANTFKANSSVMFEPYNEPHLNDVTLTGSSNHWLCWRDGGCTVKGTNTGDGSFVVAGMQEMVNAIRNTGATNIIVITGEDWGSDVSGWLQYKPVDPLNQLAVGWHSYGDGLSCQNTTCWNNVLGGIISAGYPIIATEIGQFDCNHTYIDQVMNWLDNHQAQGYTAWTWGPFSCSQDPALITNTAGNPTQTFGQGFKSHLLSLP